MAKIVRNKDLPRYRSTRDSRARVDLFTEELFGTTALKADQITYHPGDTAARHYHADAKHVFFILQGRGYLHDGEDARESVEQGDVILVEEGEVHAFSNPHDANFSFIELWVSQPEETVWVDAGDV